MNTSFFIARRLARNEKKSFSTFIIRIAILAASLSIAVMIIGSAITRGYQEVIQNKFYDCWGHIHLTTFLADPSNLNSQETIQYDSALVKNIQSIKGVKSISAYTVQSCILKSKQDIEGLLFKGISDSTQNNAMHPFIQQGRTISFPASGYSSDILISASTAESLGLSVGSDVIMYFLINNDAQPRARKMKVAGIYKTGLEDYDNLFAICDARLINHINQRESQRIHGYEIYVHRRQDKIAIEQEIFSRYSKPPLQTYLIEKRFGNVFSWLGMMKMNERIIILIMLIIAVINMITALLILVLERTQMVGVFKTMGMQNTQIQKIFVLSTLYILLTGMVIGTLLGTGLCYLQQRFEFLHLNEAIYYIRSVPVYLDPVIILSINLIALVICTLLLIIPSLIIRTISPTRAIKFN